MIKINKLFGDGAAAGVFLGMILTGSFVFSMFVLTASNDADATQDTEISANQRDIQELMIMQRETTVIQRQNSKDISKNTDNIKELTKGVEELKRITGIFYSTRKNTSYNRETPRRRGRIEEDERREQVAKVNE